MPDLDDFDFDRTRRDEEVDSPETVLLEPEPRRAPIALWASGIALLVVGVCTILYFVYRPATPKPTTAPVPPPARSLPTPVPSEPVALPPLDKSDDFVRELARSLSSHPQLLVWLSTPDVVRTFAAVVLNVADGENPLPHVRFLTPRQTFGVVDTRDGTVIDPRSFARYDAFADGVASLNAAACAAVFRQIEPLVAAAHRELGAAEGRSSETLSRAIAALLAVPLPEGDVRVVRHGSLYRFADPSLEALSPAQKLLLRMGTTNSRKVQGKLREIQAALGFTETAPPHVSSSDVRTGP
jgi:hypothetical protein